MSNARPLGTDRESASNISFKKLEGFCIARYAACFLSHLARSSKAIIDFVKNQSGPGPEAIV